MRVRMLCVIFFMLCSLYANAADSPLNEKEIQTLNSFKMHRTAGGVYYYTMTCYHDYKFDECLKHGSDTLNELFAWLEENVTHGTKANFRFKIPDGGVRCSAFSAVTPDGKQLFAHNADNPYPDAVLALTSHPANGYKSIAMTEINWLNVDITPETYEKMTLEDKRILLAAPYMMIDGVNEKGVAIGSMAVDGYLGHNQRTGKTGIFGTTLMRLVLDRAANTEEAVKLMQSYDMRAQPDFFNGHFQVTDASGDSRLIEWHSENNEKSVVVSAKIVTNHRLLLNQPTTDTDSTWRYLTIKMCLDSVKGITTVPDAMAILQRVSMDGNFFWFGWKTQWSSVYNITDKTALLVPNRDYANPVEFKLE